MKSIILCAAFAALTGCANMTPRQERTAEFVVAVGAAVAAAAIASHQHDHTPMIVYRRSIGPEMRP